MKLDVPTLAFVLSVTMFTQVVALYIQYRAKTSYHGIGWWLLGSGCMALGYVFLILGSPEPVWLLSRFGNPLLVLGRLCLLVGTLRFLDRKVDARVIGAVFTTFLVLYYHYLLVADDIALRTVVVAAAIAVYSLMIAHALLFGTRGAHSGPAGFTGTVFLLHGLYLLVIVGDTLLSGPIRTFRDFSALQVSAFIVPTITSMLWTFGFILAVNQRLSAENQEERETHRSVLKASPDDITITDLEGRILLVSPAAYRMFGYEPGEEAGRNLLEFVVPGDRERARANILHMHDGGHQRPNEYRGIRKDGSLVHMEVNSGLIHGVQGQVVKMVFVVRDITERKRTEAEKEALESRNRQLQKAESLGRMAGAIAHHFNNQLQSAVSNLELLSQAPKGTDPSRWLAGASRAVDRAAEVSRLMLAYLGQTSLEPSPTLLSELCRTSLQDLSTTLPKGVTVEAELPAPGPMVNVDPALLHQVLTNLVTNAWEAMGVSGGRIHIGIGPCRGADFPATHRFPLTWQPRTGEYACLEVSDTGSGIAEKDIEKLFDPFFTTKFPGRGLGLSVVLGNLQAHGGAVAVESRLGHGTTLKILLPVCNNASPLGRDGRNGIIP